MDFFSQGTLLIDATNPRNHGPALGGYLVRGALFGLALSVACSTSCHASDSGDDPNLEAIVVTAQKRRQPNQEVPISMVVLDGEALEKARVHSLEDMQQLAPALSVESPDGFNVLTIRGIGGGGRNIGFDPRAGLYLDGIYMGQAQALGFPLFDVEQVEVLRGPQGHLFGRNSVAGVISITHRAPTRYYESVGYGVVGTRGTRDGHWAISGPLSERLLGRVSMASERRDGLTNNSYDGQELDNIDRAFARAQLTFLPSEQLTLNLAVDDARVRQRPINGVPTTDLFGMPLGGSASANREVNFNTKSFEHVDLSGLNLTSTLRMDGGHILTLNIAHRNTHQVKQQDNDYGPWDLLSTHYVDDFKQDSQEIRLASPESGGARYVMGFYHLDERARTDRKATIGQDADVTLVRHPLFGELPFSVIGGVVPGALVTNSGNLRTRSIAAYGNLDYAIASRLTLNLGGRYTYETKRTQFDLDGSASGNFDIGVLSGYRSSRSERRLSPSVGVTFAVSENQNVYARYSQGFKSGGWNLDFIDTNAAKNPSFETETVRGLEIGTKGQALSNRLRYDAAIYSNRFQNFQVFRFVDLGAGASSIVLTNAAQAESRGVDAGVTWRVSRHLELGAYVSWVRAVFRQFDTCSATIDCTAHRLPFAPEFSSALTAGYRTVIASLGGTLGLYGEYSFHAKSFSDPVNDSATQTVPSRDMVNLRLRFLPHNSHWDFSLWVKNLFDKNTVTLRSRDFLGNLYERYMDPRTAGVEAKFSY